MIELLNMDCMDYMREQPDKSFDLAITDPPYFKGPNKSGYYGKGYSSLNVKRSKYNDGAECWDIPDVEYFKELKRVSENQIIWGANHFAGLFDSSSPAWIVWDKDNSGSSFADAELAYTSFDHAVRIFKYRWNGMIQGAIGDKRKNEIRINPTQKPVVLYDWLMSKYARKDYRILDTHLGSGSSAISAYYLGCDFVGIEKSNIQLEKTLNRFSNETRQIALL